MSCMNKVMVDKDRYREYPMKELLNVLANLRIQEINGQTILALVSKEQRLIFEVFNLSLSEPLLL